MGAAVVGPLKGIHHQYISKCPINPAGYNQKGLLEAI